MTTCASCGKGGDSLKACTGCDQVKYCNGACRKAHWKKHKKQCRKSATKNRDDTRITIDALSEEMSRIVISDDKLFKDPPPKEDCPICFLPMPFAYCGMYRVKVYQPCCGKTLCTGCMNAASDEMCKGNIKQCCPFCRVTLPTSEELLKRCKKRMEAGDADAFFMLGNNYEDGNSGLQQNSKMAFELYLQAAKLGSVEAQYQIAVAYSYGEGVEKDEEKAEHHWAIAAIGGHELARHGLGLNEGCKGQPKRAMKHFMIAAKAGYNDSLKYVTEGYEEGLVTKDEYAITLRAHKDSLDEIKSVQRTKALATRMLG